jgi:hypothetical protein
MDVMGYSIISTIAAGEVWHYSPGAPIPTAGLIGQTTLAPQGLMAEFTRYVPILLGAIATLIIGWLVATIVAAGIGKLLARTQLDEKLVGWTTGKPQSTSLPIRRWITSGIFWLIMAFVAVAFLNAIQLQVVSEPLNNFLEQIFSYLPRVGAAALLILAAWLVATLAKAVVTRGLARFNLDDQLAQQTGTAEGSPFLLSEALGNALYWFVLLFFLPIVLGTLQLQGALQPVQNLLDQILLALPKILTAVIIGGVGWLIARIVRGVTTNLLAAIGTDQIGARVGLTRGSGGLTLSALIGTIVYVLVLIPTAIAALNALQIQAISAPAVAMLERILTVIPQVFTAALILVLFYVIGRFVADLVANVLTSIGFNNVLTVLGFPQPTVTTPRDGAAVETPNGQTALPSHTPSEIAGIVVLVGVMLIGTVTATEVLGLPALTAIVNGVLAISARVLVGAFIFAVGLFLANLVFRLVAASGGRQAILLGQTARIAIIALVAAMALQQMGIANSIVNLAFGLLLGAIAVAIAIAFGLGGRDVAGEQLRGWLTSLQDNKSEATSSDELTETRR